MSQSYRWLACSKQLFLVSSITFYIICNSELYLKSIGLLYISQLYGWLIRMLGVVFFLCSSYVHKRSWSCRTFSLWRLLISTILSMFICAVLVLVPYMIISMMIFVRCSLAARDGDSPTFCRTSD
jgi:hypothetical protein